MHQGNEPKGLIRDPSKNVCVPLPVASVNTAFTNLTTAEILADPMKSVRLTSYIFQAGQPDWVQQEYEQAMGISLQAFSGLPGGRSAS